MKNQKTTKKATVGGCDKVVSENLHDSDQVILLFVSTLYQHKKG